VKQTWLGWALFVFGCRQGIAGSSGATTLEAGAHRDTGSVLDPAAPSTLPALRAPALASSAGAELAPDGGAREVDPYNRAKPELASLDLTERARHLFDAIVQNEPTLADDFFFPAAPFVPLKDVADPAKYFAQLLAAYHRDITALHRSRTSWADARFVSFELGTSPTWVKPGDEYNKIGYFRTFHGKLRTGISGTPHIIEVRTIISWDGKWYVTHLGALRH
jgi:hypothetical protein